MFQTLLFVPKSREKEVKKLLAMALGSLFPSFCHRFAHFLCNLVYNAQKEIWNFCVLTNERALILPISYGIIAELDMRWSERLLRRDACGGNFRGVCPLTGRMVFTEARKTARTRAVLPYSQLLNPRNLSRRNAAGRQTPFLSERGRNSRNSVVGNAGLAICILQADGFHIYICRRAQASKIW